MKTKDAALSVLLISFTAILGVFNVADIPVGFVVLIFFYPLLNKYFMGYFIITTITRLWRVGVGFSQIIIPATPYLLTDPDMAFITAWSESQLIVFGAGYIAVLWLISGAALMHTLSKIGYYKRIGGLLL